MFAVEFVKEVNLLLRVLQGGSFMSSTTFEALESSKQLNQDTVLQQWS